MRLITQINVSILFSSVLRLLLKEFRLNLKLTYEISIFPPKLIWGDDCAVDPAH